jgi:hypothetical protein
MRAFMHGIAASLRSLTTPKRPSDRRCGGGDDDDDDDDATTASIRRRVIAIPPWREKERCIACPTGLREVAGSPW